MESLIILLVGAGIIWAISRNTAVKQREVELKQVELKVNPDYQKYELRKSQQDLIDNDKADVKEAYDKLQEAKKSKDNDKIKDTQESYDFAMRSLEQSRKDYHDIG